MKVHEIAPEVDAARFLAGAQFIDAFRIGVDDPDLGARRAAEKMLARGPRWVDALLKLRHLIVAPFGLKTSAPNPGGNADIIGLFPVLSQTPDRLVAGFDDKHLDFRVVIDVATSGVNRNVTATTLVLTHNWRGRVYLAVITPFHRLVVRSMLRQVAA
jgi:Protein of unknown function (DUF2867)